MIQCTGNLYLMNKPFRRNISLNSLDLFQYTYWTKLLALFLCPLILDWNAYSDTYVISINGKLKELSLYDLRKNYDFIISKTPELFVEIVLGSLHSYMPILINEECPHCMARGN